jgi:hypothetical protein
MGFYDMMTGWGGGWTSWPMYLGMIAFWIGAVAFLVWGTRALSGGGPSQARHVAGESAVKCSSGGMHPARLTPPSSRRRGLSCLRPRRRPTGLQLPRALAGRPNVEEAC